MNCRMMVRDRPLPVTVCKFAGDNVSLHFNHVGGSGQSMLAGVTVR